MKRISALPSRKEATYFCEVKYFYQLIIGFGTYDIMCVYYLRLLELDIINLIEYETPV